MKKYFTLTLYGILVSYFGDESKAQELYDFLELLIRRHYPSGHGAFIFDGKQFVTDEVRCDKPKKKRLTNI